MMFLYGASGHAKVVIDILTLQGRNVDGLVDENKSINELSGRKVIHKVPDTLVDETTWIITIGENRARKRVTEKWNFKYWSAIHPSAQIAGGSTIAAGSVVMANVAVNPDCKIGAHCILNTNCSIDHDCILENYIHVSPNVALAGNVHVGEGTHIGVGASIIQGVKIGKWVTIGAGAVIIKDIPDYAVVVGVPGKIINFKKQDER